MKCPYCGFVSFEHLESCRKCSKDLTSHKSRFGIDFLEPVAINTMAFALGATPALSTADTAEDGFGTDDFSFGGLSESEPAQDTGARGLDDDRDIEIATDEDVGAGFSINEGDDIDLAIDDDTPRTAEDGEISLNMKEDTIEEKSSADIGFDLAEEAAEEPTGDISIDIDDDKPGLAPPPIPVEDNAEGLNAGDDIGVDALDGNEISIDFSIDEEDGGLDVATEDSAKEAPLVEGDIEAGADDEDEISLDFGDDDGGVSLDFEDNEEMGIDALVKDSADEALEVAGDVETDAGDEGEISLDFADEEDVDLDALVEDSADEGPMVAGDVETTTGDEGEISLDFADEEDVDLDALVENSADEGPAIAGDIEIDEGTHSITAMTEPPEMTADPLEITNFGIDDIPDLEEPPAIDTLETASPQEDEGEFDMTAGEKELEDGGLFGVDIAEEKGEKAASENDIDDDTLFGVDIIDEEAEESPGQIEKMEFDGQESGIQKDVEISLDEFDNINLDDDDHIDSKVDLGDLTLENEDPGAKINLSTADETSTGSSADDLLDFGDDDIGDSKITIDDDSSPDTIDFENTGDGDEFLGEFDFDIDDDDDNQKR
ncbi:hypothetical protein MNBD_NITROSPINAE02-1736 [hydrothermal vent metagenome]|uniref:Uncharacterized protein n=1 Tax=hydrothermal vent metagenome TaxID=652676 RepID=A0A3B1CAZ3_9ZZZZ